MGEYVVISVWTRYEMGHISDFDARWLDYSRCTAGEALTFLSDKGAGKYRARHWIDGSELSTRQLEIMRDGGTAYENKSPGPDVIVSRRHADILSEALLNALLESHEDDWSDHAEAVAAFKAVATPGHLQLFSER